MSLLQLSFVENLLNAFKALFPDIFNNYSRKGLGIFLFTTVSRTALGPTDLLSNENEVPFLWG
jgi:hypothetical protein